MCPETPSAEAELLNGYVTGEKFADTDAEKKDN